MENGLCSCLRLNCDKPGKHPRVQWREFETKLPAEHQVRGWWRRWPDASVIVLTGELSGLLVVSFLMTLFMSLQNQPEAESASPQVSR